MPASFRVYIDESGDEGFTFRPNAGGSSEWFVLSGVVVRQEKDHAVVSTMKASRELLGRPEKSALHFVDLQHQQRLAWVQTVAKCPIRTVSILCHKPSIKDPEVFKAKSYYLYHYASRLLMERVSWFCRDLRDPAKGDGVADVVFSNRRRMSYANLQTYWSKLKDEQRDVRIEWNHIDPARISAVNHDQLAGLQIADCIASSIWHAVNLDRFGNSEPRYLKEIRNTVYRYNKQAHGYGLKFWPSLNELRPSNPHLSAFDGL